MRMKTTEQILRDNARDYAKYMREAEKYNQKILEADRVLRGEDTTNIKENRNSSKLGLLIDAILSSLFL